MSPEERIRNKVAGLKQNQAERQSDSMRKQFDISVGMNGEAYKTQQAGYAFDDQNRAYHKPGEYVYSDADLQRAMDARQSESVLSNEIFDQVLRRTGSPRMAADAVAAANFTPGVGTVIGGQETWAALKDIPDGYREGNYGDMAANAGRVGMGVMDMALSMAPAAKTLFKGARALPKMARNVGEATSRGMYALDDMMAPAPRPVDQNALLQQLAKYLESRGQ